MATRCQCPLSRAISNRTSDVVNDRLRAAIGASRGLGSSAGARPSNEPVNEVQIDALLVEVVMPVLAAAVTTKHPHLLTPGHEFSHDGLLLAADVGAVHDEARTHALSNNCIGIHLRAARKRPGTTEDHERDFRHRHVPSTPSGPPRFLHTRATTNVSDARSTGAVLAADAYLVRTGRIIGAEWHFFAGHVPETIGADKRNIDLLVAVGIPFTVHVP